MFEFSWVDGLVFVLVVVAVCWLIGRLIRFFARPAAGRVETQKWDITIRDARDSGPQT